MSAWEQDYLERTEGHSSDIRRTVMWKSERGNLLCTALNGPNGQKLQKGKSSAYFKEDLSNNLEVPKHLSWKW